MLMAPEREHQPFQAISCSEMKVNHHWLLMLERSFTQVGASFSSSVFAFFLNHVPPTSIFAR